MSSFALVPAVGADAESPQVAAPLDPAASAPAPDGKPTVPWDLLEDRRLTITTDDGTTTEGVFLGLDHGAAIVVGHDGGLESIPTTDVVDVRVITDAPAPAMIQAPLGGGTTTLAFREAETRAQLDRAERLARITRKTTIAGSVAASLSAAASIVAEGFNIRRWSLSKRTCGEDDYYGYGYDGYDRGITLCGWSDGSSPRPKGSYSYGYGGDNLYGIAVSNTIALSLHVAAGPTMLLPPTLLRDTLPGTAGRRRHLAAWALWGVGLGSFVGNQAVSWTQVFRSREVCDPNDECSWITATRGAPPGLYLLTAGLTVSSMILGILDAKTTTTHADTAVAKSMAKRRAPMMSLFPFRIRSGGGVGVIARF